jgi:hypothetical protein
MKAGRRGRSDWKGEPKGTERRGSEKRRSEPSASVTWPFFYRPIENWIFPQAESFRPALWQITVLQRLDRHRGGYVLRLDGSAEVEFVVVNLFESLEAVKRFAGSDYKTPIFEPEAKKPLCRIEPIANHYEVRAVQ